ncbi:related to proposed vacuolar iron transport protein [Fusarium torulosum]|uniref:Related to proposed vacuolar iron transport protein n=1 Tax=Fusarium torulosum TaxID=33205 RepID=A0AAE8MAJ0_9HYPO|nr:related to proposed vacuolar iron transport protein [Fusarium torulosum]
MSASKRFLSDFTLGFSDGLTVPFALTAGLSSLGKTDTVITGGLAELCAGSISMGIGGYLAARDQCAPCQNELDVEQRHDEHERISESDSMVEQSEKTQILAEELVRQHLEPLHLPSSLVTTFLNGMSREPTDLQRVVSRLQTYKDPSSAIQTSPQSPIMSGLSISLGYAIGGIIPLLPYFFTN